MDYFIFTESLEPILHCDLKLSKILLDFDLKPTIVDFGLSRILKYGDMSDRFSATNIRGSIDYMAPGTQKIITLLLVFV